MLIYPEDLHSSRTGHHFIHFIIQDITHGTTTTETSVNTPSSSNFNSAASDIQSSLNNMYAIKDISAFLDSVQAKSSSRTQSTSQSNQDSGNVAQDVWKWISTPANTKTVENIAIYMPDSINMNQKITYQDNFSLTKTLGNVGLGAEAGMQVGSITEKVMQDKGNLTNAIKTIGSNPFGAEAAGRAVSTITGANADDTSELALRKAGYAVNPQMEVMFQQIEFRTFQYNFNFMPRSQSEAQQINEIIKAFRMYSAPGIDTSGVGRYYTLPAIFQIEYCVDYGDLNKYLHKFAPSVLTSIYVDYSPNGWATFEDGFPARISMMLQFMEIEMITRDKIKDGY